MSLYDDAGLISLPTGAAGKDGMLYNIKPVEKLKDAERLTNGDFSDGSTGWTVGNHITISNGEAVFDGGTYANLKWAGAFEAGKTYKVSVEATIRVGSFTVADGAGGNVANLVNRSGKHYFYITATSADLYFVSFNLPFDFTIDNVSVREAEQEAKDFVFERNSNLTATRVGPGGLIEKGRENVIKNSNDFSVAVGNDGWQKDNSTVTSGQDGYDGTTNAWKLSSTVSTTSNSIKQNHSGISTQGDQVSTFSVYLKAGNTDWARLNMSNTGNVYFDLSGDGAVGTESSANVRGEIQKIGSQGWFRCSITKEGGNDFDAVFVFIAASDGNLLASDHSESKHIFVQSAQLESGLVATDYMYSDGTTGKAGILEDEPRFNHLGGGCPGLLLEGEITSGVSAQNLVLYSEYFGDYTETNTTISDTLETSPEGVKNAYKVLETSATNVTHKFVTTGSHGLESYTNGNSYSVSVFAKAAGRTKFRLKAGTTATAPFAADFTLSGDGTAAAATGNDSNANVSIEKYGNGWYRCKIENFTATDTASTRRNIFLLNDSGQDQYDGDTSKGMIFYGYQVEKSSFATSYIPTHGTAGTRVRDDVGVISNTTTDGLTNGYNTTIYAKFKLLADKRGSITGLVNYYVPISGLQNDPRMLLYTSDSSGGTFLMRIQYRVGGVSDHDLIIETPNDSRYNVGDEVKAIARITDFGITLFVNGTKFTFEDYANSTTAGRPFKKSLSGSTMNGIDLTYSPNAAQHELYEVITFPKALTDDECEDLTTL